MIPHKFRRWLSRNKTLQVNSLRPRLSQQTTEMTREQLDEKHDRGVWQDMKSRLRQMKHVNNVHTLFESMKPKIQDIKQRNPEAAQQIVKLFLDAEDKLTTGEA